MTPHDTNTRSTPNGDAGQRMILVGAVSVALISTAAAYQAMVGFGTDVLAMGTTNAWAFAGVFELSLVTVALMARQAATQDRPARTLLTLTWVLSALSGFFAGWHEIHLGHPATAAGFRFIVPLLAALMWHLALVGDRHLAMERSWSDLRMGARMHALFRARVARRRAIARNDGSRRARRRIAQANARWERAEDVALRTVPPLQMRRHVDEWRESFAAVEGAREPADRFALETSTHAKVTAVVEPAFEVADGLLAEIPATDEQRAQTTARAIETDARALPEAARAQTQQAARADENGQVPAARAQTARGAEQVDTAVDTAVDAGEPRDARDDSARVETQEVTRAASSARQPAPQRARTETARAQSQGGARGLTDDQLMEAMTRAAAGESWTEIGRALGFHRSTIQRAVEKAAPQTPPYGLSLASIEQAS